MEYHSAIIRNKYDSVELKWMNLEPIIQSEVSQEEKNKYHVLTLDSKEIKPVNPKGNQPWIFTGRTDAEAPILWSPDANSWFIGKDPDAGKDEKQEKGTTEDEMVGWQPS